MKKSLISKLALYTGILLVASACLEKEEGCLDPNALNLDVSADVNANCQYPSLRLNVSHRWVRPVENDTLNFRIGDVYAFGNDFVTFSSFQYYLSEVSLGDVPTLSVFDTVVTLEETYFKDDLTLISPTSFQFEAGDINRFGTYEGFAMSTGFDDQWYTVDTVRLLDNESTHPWFATAMRGKMNDRYTCRLAYTLYTQMPDTIHRSFGAVISLPSPMSKNGTFRVDQANHADVGLFIDYHELLNDVDLESADSIAIVEQILSNMDAALRIIN